MDETSAAVAVLGTPAPVLGALRAMPYHEEIVALLRAGEPEAWAWAGSAAARSDRADEVRAFLLQHTYRLDADAHPKLHACCEAAAGRLGVTAPVTLYQGSDPHANASLLYLPGEAHIVFNGSLLERLAGAELEAVCGHELSHYLLYERDGGAWFTASRLLAMAQDDSRSDASLLETARLFSLYTEAFADRGGAVACGARAREVADRPGRGERRELPAPGRRDLRVARRAIGRGEPSRGLRARPRAAAMVRGACRGRRGSGGRG